MIQEESSTLELHKKQYQNLEYKLLSYSELKINQEIFSLNVPISNGSWIHEVCCGKEEKHIVLLHGYGGSSITFIRLFKQLSKQYTVHALDLLGMGLSHRKQFNKDWNREEVVKYFIQSIEEWRKERKISKMVVAGHSYGGYISSCYASKYPSRISRLCLISPAGTRSGSEETYEEQYERLYSQSTFGRKIILSIMKKFVKCQITPSRAMNWFCIGPMVMDRALTGRLKLQDKQKQDWVTYMKTMSKMNSNSQISFWKLFFMPNVSTPNSISSMFSKTAVPFKIDFYYGDNDWMQKQTAFQMSKSIQKVNRISYTTIPNSGHQILFDNPAELISHLL